MSSQKKIIKGTIQVGFFILLSRFLGIIREVLMVHYLGVSGLSDAFLTAYKIPNSLRKVFAEGALSAAFVPRVVSLIKKEGNSAVAGLVALAFLFFEGFVLCLCAIVMLYAHWVLSLIAPGFSQEQLNAAVPILRIVMPFIFFISSSALLAGALQAVGHFFVPAFSQVLINIVVICGLLLSYFFALPVTQFCWFILAGGVAQLIMHSIAYFFYGFSFTWPTAEDYKTCMLVLGAFLLCLPSVSIMEIALFVDTSFASYLKPGSLSLIYYANRFVGIPLGVFAVAFSTILLPHFSRVSTYSPKRLHFYLLESTKFIFWVTFPIMLSMFFFSYDIFSTIFSSKFTTAQVVEASDILRVLIMGLFFFSLNKILLNIFYAMHSTWIPATISLCTTALNSALNYMFIEQFQAIGLAAATIIATVMQSVALLLILYRYYGFRLYISSFCVFLVYYLVQIACAVILFLCVYYGAHTLLFLYMPHSMSYFFTKKIGLWLWVGPLVIFFMALLFYFRSCFKIQLYFLK